MAKIDYTQARKVLTEEWLQQAITDAEAGDKAAQKYIAAKLADKTPPTKEQLFKSQQAAERRAERNAGIR